jgi:two-component system CheB/CheR fusion protein
MASKKKNDSSAPLKTEQDFPIVGIGASAGGLDAFTRFLKAIPNDSGMAYVLVQHLDPTHESILPEILSRVTKIPVLEITDDIHLVPNCIYVIPENKTLTSSDGVLKLTPRNKIKTNTAIDVFFTSLAEVHQSLAVGVVLSGTASDGTLGLKAIKANGGITFAQDQQSAKYGEMPQNAVDAEVVDFVLPPEKMPEKLVYIMHAYSGYTHSDENILKDDEDVFNQIILVLRQRSGVDFTYYKQTTVRRRIARRMVISEKIKLDGYLKFLIKNPAEQDALFHDMLIPVTSFFRDSKIFQTITQTVFPALLKNKSVADPIRIWVAGCSTGEEVYSLAISLHQFLEKISGRQIQIFASDISESAVAKARTGIYRAVDVKNVPDSILKNYFAKTSGGYQVNRQIREMCVFAIHDFLKDPPFAKMDLISCRNVLIYMDTFLQKKALSTFHYALKENGFLLLGKSETTGPAAELFTTFAKEDKIYSRKSVPSRFMHQSSERKESALIEKVKKTSKPEVLQNDFRKSAEAILLSKFIPPSVIVNEQMDVVHINGLINPFLEAPQGKPTFNLLKMAREGLAFELRNTLHKVKTSNAPAVKEGILIKYDGKIIQITIEILPLPNSVEPHFLILFYKTALPEKKLKSKGNPSVEKNVNNEAFQRIEQLENEITLTREDMRVITEDQEAVNEELQSANEELLSSSEELQSLNEELETSKEELQSTNEELIIINQEMLDKQEQINATRLYAEAIIATVREPLVVMDKDLRIKSINSSFFKKFNITEEEAEGKLIYELQNHLFDNSQLRSLLEKILPQKTELSDYEISIPLPLVGECTLLLNARHVINEKNKEQLILLAMEDITERKTLAIQAELAKKIAQEEKIKAENATLIAEDAAKSKQQFLSNMSHEIRTPMNAIIGFTKVVLKTELSAKQKEYLEAIKTSGDALIILVNDILDLAKVDSGKMTFAQIPFTMSLSISAMIHLFEIKIQEKNLELITEYDTEIPDVLLGDSVRLHQIILNLLSNAVKFTSKGKITVSVRLLSEDAEKVTVEFAVADTGIGIAKNKISTIFEKFQQATSETSSLYGGTGLGLAIVKQLVEAQGGTVTIKSKINEGSTFSFKLDFQKTKAGIKSEKVIERIDTKTKSVKVLVVEDIALNQLLMRTLLDDFGYEYDMAVNGKIAIEKLRTQSYDIILMDLQMPEMNGFEATEYIRTKMKSTTPIIALTADVTTVDLEKCKAVGMNDYIAKPIDEGLLYSKIVELIQ